MPLDVDWIRAQLPGRTVLWREAAESTMIEARGCAPGTLVLAEEQTAGQGRLGRMWHSEREAGLYVSTVLRLEPQPVVTLALGLAVVEAVTVVSGLECDLRWPNDVLVGGRKCVGILVQKEGEELIAGIGINVNHAAFPPEIAGTATSLRIASGRPQSRERILVKLAHAIDEYAEILATKGPGPVVQRFTQVSSYACGKRVVVDGRVSGTTIGLDAAGFLRLRKDDGTEEVILAGGVRPE
jgi:BirA family transcriptional regulator, biotin operon repressor / biotin---[acetyl-CoA-carboxylase] ligase